MKTINVYNYGNDVIHGISYHSTFTYEEFCESIDYEDAKHWVMSLPHTYNILDEPDDYITDLLDFFAGKRNKDREIYIRHCDTYLTDYVSNDGHWRVQLHINIAAYPSIVRLYEAPKEKRDYQIFFSGKDNIVLTFYLKAK